MTFDFIKKLFKKNAQKNSADFLAIAEGKFRYKIGNGYFYIEDQVSNGYGGYRPVNMYLLNENDPSFCLMILDKNGRIKNFPGLTKGDWKKNLEIPTSSHPNFSFSLYNFDEDGTATVEWTLQPDGRYFEDEDGFGSENCIEIVAYSRISKDGKYTKPFTVE